MTDDLKQLTEIINQRFHSLSMAIFNQAITDLSLATTSKAIKNDAWRWLIGDGYLFVKDGIGFDVAPGKYISMLESIINKNKSQGKKKKVNKEAQLTEDLLAFESLGVESYQVNEYLAILESVRNKSSRERHTKSPGSRDRRASGSNSPTTAKLGRGGEKSKGKGLSSARVNRMNFIPNVENPG